MEKCARVYNVYDCLVYGYIWETVLGEIVEYGREPHKVYMTFTTCACYYIGNCLVALANHCRHDFVC